MATLPTGTFTVEVDGEAEPPAAFTPGPWMIPSGMKRIVSQGSWHTIALCAPESNPNWTLLKEPVVDANARLIAAAPDLLAALTEVLNECDAVGSPALGTCERARIAIAKAVSQ